MDSSAPLIESLGQDMHLDFTLGQDMHLYFTYDSSQRTCNLSSHTFSTNVNSTKKRRNQETYSTHTLFLSLPSLP